MTDNPSLDDIAAQYDDDAPVSDGFLEDTEPPKGEQFGYDNDW
mgnify:CR=1 FL=1